MSARAVVTAGLSVPSPTRLLADEGLRERRWLHKF